MGDFGHCFASGTFPDERFHIDAWGTGPFFIRVLGKRYKFEDSDMFGPFLLNKDGSVSSKQPISERHPFWLGYQMWRNGGRRVRWGGRVCVYEKPKPGTYWKDPATRLSWFLSDPPYGLEHLGYVEVERPKDAD